MSTCGGLLERAGLDERWWSPILDDLAVIGFLDKLLKILSGRLWDDSVYNGLQEIDIESPRK